MRDFLFEKRARKISCSNPTRQESTGRADGTQRLTGGRTGCTVQYTSTFARRGHCVLAHTPASFDWSRRRPSSVPGRSRRPAWPVRLPSRQCSYWCTALPSGSWSGTPCPQVHGYFLFHLCRSAPPFSVVCSMAFSRVTASNGVLPPYFFCVCELGYYGTSSRSYLK